MLADARRALARQLLRFVVAISPKSAAFVSIDDDWPVQARHAFFFSLQTHMRKDRL
jgi:hypothetical protein